MYASYPNIERSAFQRGAYVGYDSLGNVYHIKRDGPRDKRGPWWCRPIKWIGPNTSTMLFYAPTLALVSERLAKQQSTSSHRS